MLSPRPSAAAAPSIWYAAVAAPHRKSVGNEFGMGSSGRWLADEMARPCLDELPVGARPARPDELLPVAAGRRTRNGREQELRVRVQRVLQHVVGRTLLDDPSC